MREREGIDLRDEARRRGCTEDSKEEEAEGWEYRNAKNTRDGSGKLEDDRWVVPTTKRNKHEDENGFHPPRHFLLGAFSPYHVQQDNGAGMGSSKTMHS